MNVNLVDNFHRQVLHDCNPNTQQSDVDRKIFMSPYDNENTPILNNIKVQLCNKQMWKQFHAETTEMIITKLGRRMFPPVQINVHGLDHHAIYFVLMEIIPISKYRHKYIGNSELLQRGNSNFHGNNCVGWTTAGTAEPQPPIDHRIYLHPDSPASGLHWMQQPINFTKLKLTNNSIDHHNNVVLTSMHKYIPRIWIFCAPNTTKTIANLFNQPSISFTFAETAFIAVTAYQNENITKLKINNNPFAKGFRETGQSRCKRKYNTLNDNKIRDEVESDNIMSSDSESHEKDIKKYINDATNSNDNRVNTMSEVTPPVSISSSSMIHHRKDQLKLHRPWVDCPSSLSLTIASVSNINAQIYSPSDLTSQSVLLPSNHAISNFTHFLPMLSRSMEHNRLLNTIPWGSRYQYYQPSTFNTTQIYR